MEKCPNCGQMLVGSMVCPVCGFDASTDCLSWPTLCLPLEPRIPERPALPGPEPETAIVYETAPSTIPEQTEEAKPERQLSKEISEMYAGEHDRSEHRLGSEVTSIPKSASPADPEQAEKSRPQKVDHRMPEPSREEKRRDHPASENGSASKKSNKWGKVLGILLSLAGACGTILFELAQNNEAGQLVFGVSLLELPGWILMGIGFVIFCCNA